MENKRTYGKAITNLVLAVVIGILMITVLPKCLSFFMPFVIGLILSALAAVPVRFLEERLKIKRKAGTVCVIIFVLAMILLAIYFGGLFLTEQVKTLIDELPEVISRFKREINEISISMAGVYEKLPTEIQEIWDSLI